MLCTKKYRRQGVILLAGLAVGVLVGNVCLKNLIARPRPCWLDDSVMMLISSPADYSFPSGHTLSSVIGATVLTKTDRRFGWAAIPLAAGTRLAATGISLTGPVTCLLAGSSLVAAGAGWAWTVR